MSSSETLYAPRFRHPQVLVRGRAQRALCEVYRDGSQVTVSSGTYTLFDPDQSEVVSASAVSIDGNGGAYYDLNASTELTSTRDLGAGWLERWNLVMPDGVTHEFIRDAYLGIWQAYPPVSDVDILDLYPDMADELLASVTHMQRFGDAAWSEVIRWLFSIGVWPQRNVTTSALFDVHLHTWLRNVFAYLVRRTNDERFTLMWEHHRDETTRARTQVTMKLDQDEDGFADEEHRRGITPVVHVNVPPRGSLIKSTRW